MNTEPLELRDIHLPIEISWWPPAIGWWVVAGLITLGVMLALWLWQRHQWRKNYRHACRRLDAIDTQFRRDGDASQLLQSLSILLRQAALHWFPCDHCANLTGDDWLHFLDISGDNKQFSQGAGQALFAQPYSNQPVVDSEALLRLTREWLAGLPTRPMQQTLLRPTT
jgi:hypothetical protein